MSDIHNHTLCAVQTLDRLKNEDLLRSIQRNMPLYLFGAMGGDIFLYLNFANGDQWAEEISEQFHSDPNLLFALFKDYYGTVEKANADALTAYLMGFVSHHALDVSTHPFINYHAGFEVEGREETRKYRYAHKRYEVILDVLFAAYRQSKMISLDFLNQLKENDLAIVTGLVRFVLQKTKKELIPDHLLAMCLNDCKKLLSLASNRPLSYLMRTADRLSPLRYRFSRPFFFVTKQERKVDALNLSHRMWRHPNDKTLQMNYSYPELFAYAIKDGASDILHYHAYLQGQLNNIDRIFHHHGFNGYIEKSGKNGMSFMQPILL